MKVIIMIIIIVNMQIITILIITGVHIEVSTVNVAKTAAILNLLGGPLPLRLVVMLTILTN